VAQAVVRKRGFAKAIHNSEYWLCNKEKQRQRGVKRKLSLKRERARGEVTRLPRRTAPNTSSNGASRPQQTRAAGRKKRTEKRWRSPVPPAHCLTVPRGPDCSALFSSAATFIPPSTRGVCKGALRHRGRGGRTSAERRYAREDRQGGLWSSARFACGAVASSSPQECLHGFFFVSSDLHAPLRSVAASPTAAWVPVRPTAADRTLAARREAGARPATGATRATEAVADMQAILIRGWGQRGCVKALGAKGNVVVSFRQMGIICFGIWEFYLKNEGSFQDCLVLSWSDVVG